MTLDEAIKHEEEIVEEEQYEYQECVAVHNMEGAMNYQDSEDENVTNARLQSLTEAQMKTLQHLQLLGWGADEAKQKIAELFSFEKSYGKDAYFSYRHQDSEYGAYSKCEEQMSLDELAALCPNYPVKETVLKFGKGGSPSYSVFEKNWLNTSLKKKYPKPIIGLSFMEGMSVQQETRSV